MSFVRNYALSKFFGKGSSGSGGGDIKALVERTITEIEDDTIEVVGNSAFKYCTALKHVKLQNAKALGHYAFEDCTALTSLEIPNVTRIGEAAFRGCIALTYMDLPNVTELVGGFIPRDTGLKKMAFHSFVTISATYCLQTCKVYDFYKGFKSTTSNVFGACTAVVIRNTDSLSVLGSYESYWNCKILVPSVLLEEYKAGTNWSSYANQIFPVEDYTLDGTVMGELDLVKLGVA